MNYRCLYVSVAMLAVLAARTFAGADARDNAPVLHSPPQPIPTCVSGLYVDIEPGDYVLPDLMNELQRQTGYAFSAMGDARQRKVTIKPHPGGSTRTALVVLLHGLVRDNTGLTLARDNGALQAWEETERKIYLAERTASNPRTSDRQLPGNERNTRE